MAAPPRPGTPEDVPEGWHIGYKVDKKDGTTKKYYGNVLGQTYFDKTLLLSYVDYAKEAGLSIYKPGFQASTSGIHRNKKKKQDEENKKKQREEKNKKLEEKKSERECARALLGLTAENRKEKQCATSAQTVENSGRRTSRRLAGVEPELKDEFISSRPLEYVLKEKPHQ